MAEELTPEELEHARLYEQEIKSIEKNLLEVLDGSNLLQPSINRILTLSRERNIQIDSRLWEMLVSSNYNYHFCDRQVTETIANNPNPSIKATIFECIHEEIYLDTKQISKSNYKNNLFESLIGSTNPNFPHNLLDKLLQKTIEGLKGRDLEYIDKEQTFNIFSTIFGSSNPLLKWKNESGEHKLLQFLNTNTYVQLISKLGADKFAELLIILANNKAIHTPDLIEKLLELAKRNKELKKALLASGSDCVPVKLLLESKVKISSERLLISYEKNANYFFGDGSGKSKIKITNLGSLGITNSCSEEHRDIFLDVICSDNNSEILNLTQTFENLLEALKFARLQSEQFRLANISALRAKLKKDSFENLIDIRNENSIPKLFVSIANNIQKLNLLQRNFTEKGLIQEFEKIVNTFRFDLINDAGIAGRAYQFEYTAIDIVTVNESNVTQVIYEIINNDKISFIPHPLKT